MRFGCVRGELGSRLCVEVGATMLEVASLAPDLEGFADVGALLRAGPAAMDRIRAACAAAPAGLAGTEQSALDWAPPSAARRSSLESA